MSRPYANPMEFGQAPPLRNGTGVFADSISPTGGAAPSFKTNVNRQKTKRWVEAKSFSYDGDDWGEADEYDEYRASERLPPPTAAVNTQSKPTGLRQRGQSIDTAPAAPAGAGLPPASISRAAEASRRDVSAPIFTQRPQSPGHGQSFIARSDERRASPSGSSGSSSSFSTGPQLSSAARRSPDHIAMAQNASQAQRRSPLSHQRNLSQVSEGPQQLHIQTQVLNAQQDRHHPVTTSNEQSDAQDATPHSGRMASSTYSQQTNTPSDVMERRDFSPSALPPPLMTAAAPGPHLARQTLPADGQAPRVGGMNNPTSSPPDTRTRADSNSGSQRTLPFIRPADIYKRIAEEREKEKERASLDSSRPSLDSNQSRRPSDCDLAVPGPGTRSQTSSDSLDRSVRMSPSNDGLGLSEQGTSLGGPRSNLDSVREGQIDDERKIAKSLHHDQDDAVPSGVTDIISPTVRSSDVSPALPSISRFSLFGVDLFPSSIHGEDLISQATRQSPPQLQQHLAQHMTSPDEHYSDAGSLQHQPSLGIRSVVNQAFEQPLPSSSSATPASSVVGSQRSQVGSDPTRSDTASTSNISPIMSRVEGPAHHTPAIAQGPTDQPTESFDSRPISQETVIPAPIKSEPEVWLSQSPIDEVEILKPATFVPSHRRDLSIPSSTYGPARTPAVVDGTVVTSAEQAEPGSSSTTPTISSPNVQERRMKPMLGGLAGDLPRSETPPREAITSAPRTMTLDTTGRSGSPVTAAKSALMHRASSSTSSSPRSDDLRSNSPVLGTPSPTRVKVKSVADEFEAARSRSGSSQSLQRAAEAARMIPVGKVQEGVTPYRPAVGREQSEISFRPALPGGWISYATTNVGPGTGPPSPGLPSPAPPAVEQEEMQTPTMAQEPITIPSTDPPRVLESVVEERPRTSVDPAVNAIAAASGALEGGLGIENQKWQAASETVASSGLPHADIPKFLTTLPPNHSEALSVSANSSAPPTPPPKDTPLLPTEQSSDYFSRPPVPLKAQYERRISGMGELPKLHRPEIQPNLSTEASPHDQESDRLRKEIVKSLSPTTSALNRDQLGATGRPISTDSRLGTGEGNSFLPSEYESYWASQADTPASPIKTTGPSLTTTSAVAHSAAAPLPRQLQEVVNSLSDAPRVDDSSLQARDNARPGLLQQRFSWEQGSELQLQPGALASKSSQLAASNAIQAASPEQSEQANEGHRAGQHDSAQLQQLGSFSPLAASMKAASGMVTSGHTESTIRNVMPSAAPVNLTVQETTGNRPIGEGTSPVEVMTSAPNAESLNLPSSPGNYPGHEGLADHQGASAEKPHSERPEPKSTIIAETVGPLMADPVAQQQQLPSSQQVPAQHPNIRASNQPKIPAFREIMALKTSSERISTFNASREQLAHSDVGLSHWIQMTASKGAELSKAMPLGRPMNPTGLLQPQTGSNGLPTLSGPPATQPHYQQYLNHSITAGGSSQVGQGPSHPISAGGSSEAPQTFSPSGLTSTKLTRREVEARGKDLLHTAGVFSGKANTAAKGLFAKGKSRFRVSGSGEKGDH